MKNLIQRSLTGIVYVALIVCAVLAQGWWYIALFALIVLLAIREFETITNASTGGQHTFTLVLDMLGAIMLFAAVSIPLSKAIPMMSISAAFAITYMLYLVARLVVQLYTLEKSPLVNLAFSFMGQIYIALPLSLLSVYYILPDGRALMLAMFIMIWLSDTGAFCVGSLTGRHKLFPRISPAKSWEGFAGGVIFAVGAAFVMKYGFGQWFEDTPTAMLAGLGAVTAIFATWGDLVESLIKRTLGVKDSGHLLPGHGGILDRIDSLLLVIPATLIYWFILMFFR